jgi:hypothetical protein
MRSTFAAFLIALCLSCTDSGDITGAGKENLSVHIDVTGDASLAPQSFRLSLDGINWQTISGGEDHHLVVPAGDHKVGLTPFDNIIDLGWCLQLEPSSIAAHFKKNNLLYARFNVYCPTAVGTGSLAVLIKTSGGPSSAAFSVVFTRIVGIPGSQTLSIQPGTPVPTVLAAGLYRVALANAGFCRLSSPNPAGVPAIAVRNGESTILTLNVTCIPPFTLPPGIP